MSNPSNCCRGGNCHPYRVGDTVELHVVAKVVQVTENYAWVQPNDGSGPWTVEYDDSQWKKVDTATEIASYPGPDDLA